jgi:DNA-binding XRE family transcriptional regulator
MMLMAFISRIPKSRRACSDCYPPGLILIGTLVPGNIVPSVFAIPPMDLRKTMATNVRRTRHAKQMTQEELADRAGLSDRYLGSIERAAVSASVTVLGRLAEALDVDACELISVSQRR